MKEVSCGAVVFRREAQEIKILLLFRKAHDQYAALWDCPRGHIETGETEEQTARREVQEETGITNLKILPKFRESIDWFYMKYGKRTFKQAIYYCAETKEEKIILSSEHQDYKWVSFEEALTLVKFPNTKQVLKKAQIFLQSSL
ncbi:NUDIX domain-containing protein [Candidatus Woesearchaeota archaeon]|nr:NUDIX domain-containing protein [Candidatus Woesearchaeota archaeon]